MSAPVVVKQFPLDKEYAKKTGVTPEDIVKLRTWLATQPHLPGDLLTDLDLALVYHSCKNSAEVSKQVLDLHFTLKTLFVTFFKDRLVTDKTFCTLSMCALIPLKTRAHDGSAILYCCITDPDAQNFVFHECIRATLMIVELWQEEEGTWPGLQIIIDMRIMNMQHLTKLDLQMMQQFLYYLQEAMLVRVTALHFINSPSFIDKLMMLMRPFLKKELMEVFFIHQVGSTTLEKHMSMEGLPEEAAAEGMAASVMKTSEDLKERIRLNKDFFERENKRRVVEAKRPGKPKTITDIFGSIEGSFKKLNID